MKMLADFLVPALVLSTAALTHAAETVHPGRKHVSTPRIDQMVAEGMKQTSFYVTAPEAMAAFAKNMSDNSRPAAFIEKPKPLSES